MGKCPFKRPGEGPCYPPEERETLARLVGGQYQRAVTIIWNDGGSRNFIHKRRMHVSKGELLSEALAKEVEFLRQKGR